MDGSFGYEGRLPWPKIKEDLEFFKNTTCNYVVVMGRNTWSKLPTLPNRISIVVTSTPIEGVICLHPDTYLADLKNFEEETGGLVFLIGGAQLLSVDNLKLCDKIYHTTIKGTFNHDVSISADVLLYLSQLHHKTIKETDKCTIREYITDETIS